MDQTTRTRLIWELTKRSQRIANSIGSDPTKVEAEAALAEVREISFLIKTISNGTAEEIESVRTAIDRLVDPPAPEPGPD